ncbi:MAG: carboxypeptidase regulatory-like domain-containing protein [Acidobacteriia bacterium]|nr:carboxypeptidase regulatory-like domain-containing protein [Terriglobia bacterium]
MYKRILTFVLVPTFAAITFAQQLNTAAIFGTVTDPQGSAIPGALVTLTQVATGQVRSVNSTQSGEYLFSLLPVGTYRLAVEKQGFQGYRQSGILAHANDNIKVDVALKVGSTKTIVSVSGAASQVETRSMTLKETMNSQSIQDLPLNGRNPGDLALNTAGVVSGEGGVSGNTGEGATIRGEKTFSINGSRQNNTQFTLDGGINTDNLYGYGMPFPFPDAVQEFSVESSNMSLQQSSASSGSINIVTKSGTNEVHGDVFWYVRNTAFDGRSFFSDKPDVLKQNQEGFTLGFPIKKNKLFLFGGVQPTQIRTASGASRALTLSAAEQTGDFSADAPITDPLTGQPFSENKIPPSRLSQAALNLLSHTPLPGPDGFAHFTYRLPENDLQYIGRADYIISDKNRLTFRYFENDQNVEYDSPPDDIFAAQANLHNWSQSGTLADTYIVHPNLMVHTQFTGLHLVGNDASNLKLTMADLGVKVYAPSNDITVALISSGIGYGTPAALHFARATEELLHDWTWMKGSHTVTWGGRLAWEQYNENTVFLSSGAYDFDGHVTGLDRADFMLGQMSFFEQINGELENRRQPEEGVYFGDVWRATRRLTLSAGIRWEPYTFFTDTKNRNQTFYPGNYYKGVKSTVFLNAPPGLLYYGDVDPSGRKLPRGVTRSTPWNFGPRIGIAWDPFGNGKTSLRAAYGIYYGAPQLNQLNNANDVAPFSYQVSFDNGLFDDPYAGRESLDQFPVKNFSSTAPFQSPLYTIVNDNYWPVPYSQNWSFTVERQVAANTMVSLAYIATKGTHLYGDYDENAPIYDHNLTLDQNLANINSRRPFQGYQGIVRGMNGLNSTYNSLQISVDKRLSHGLTGLASYTWSKSLDYISLNTYVSVILVQNPFNFFFRRGPSDQNVPQRFVASFVWDLPNVPQQTPKVAKTVLRNWRFSGMVTLQSGLPFTVPSGINSPAIGTSTLGAPGSTVAYADLIGAGNPVLHASSRGAEVAEYFDITRFAEPAPGTYGTVGRNALRGPGYANMDASLVRGFPLRFLGEAGRFELRLDAFNLFNRPNFGQPDTGLTSSTFGQLTYTIGNARLLQVAAKIVF